MNNNIMNNNINNKKTIYLIIGVIIGILLIAGGTYAYITLAVNVTNGNYSSVTGCFDIDYNVTNEDGTLPITGTMYPSSNPSGGLNGRVSLSVKNTCNVNGVGILKLNVVNGNSTLLKTVGAHCENSQTLKTLTDYTTSSSCTGQQNGVWVTNGTALKYAVYDTNSVTSSTIPLGVGYVTNTSGIQLLNNINITSTVSNYYVYIWLDGNLIDNSYLSLAFNGNISATATQIDS